MVTMLPDNNDDALRLGRALLGKLGVAPDHVTKDSLTVQFTGGTHVIVEWRGFATMPVAEFRQLLDGLEVER